MYFQINQIVVVLSGCVVPGKAVNGDTLSRECPKCSVFPDSRAPCCSWWVSPVLGTLLSPGLLFAPSWSSLSPIPIAWPAQSSFAEPVPVGWYVAVTPLLALLPVSPLSFLECGEFKLMVKQSKKRRKSTGEGLGQLLGAVWSEVPLTEQMGRWQRALAGWQPRAGDGFTPVCDLLLPGELCRRWGSAFKMTLDFICQRPP